MLHTPHIVLRRATLAAHPGWRELARTWPTARPGLGPPPQAGAAAVAQGDKQPSGCLDGAIVLLPSGRDVVVFAAALPRARLAPMSLTPPVPPRMLTQPSLIRAFRAALQGRPSLTGREIKLIHLLTTP